MSRLPQLYPWLAALTRALPPLSAAQLRGLAWFSFGMVLAHSCSVTAVATQLADLLGQKFDTVKQRLREWYCEATAKTGYTLSGDTRSWQFTFAALPTHCAAAPTDTPSSCASPNGTYTIPATAGVTYLVNGKQTAPGTYSAKAGSSVKITAFGTNGQALPGASTWTLHFAATQTGCTAHVPTFVDNTCTRHGTYTIPGVTTADYTVNGVAVSAGTHHATAGATLTIRVSAKPGQSLTGTTSWTHTFADLPQCAPDTPSASGSLPQTGPDVPVGKASLLAGLLALVGTALLFAGRKPSRPGRHSAR